LCVDTMTDRNNCGSCAKHCIGNKTCNGGQCK
jgi:hypothetical protein